MTPAEALWAQWTDWLSASGVHWRSATMDDAAAFAGERAEVLLALSLRYAELGVWPPAFEARVCGAPTWEREADDDGGDAIRLASAMDVARRKWGAAAVIRGEGRPRAPAPPPSGPGCAA